LEDVIIELRGNGVIMTVYEIELETLEFLKQRSEKFGEDLNQAWFDPFFWHPKEMQQLKSQIKKRKEYRGLMCDDISFIEIRRKGKHRKKYLVKELLGEGQLFPMVTIAESKIASSIQANINCLDVVHGTGCLGNYVVSESDYRFNLWELEFWPIMIEEQGLSSFLLGQYQGVGLNPVLDDFIIRNQVVSFSEGPLLNHP